MIKLIGDKYANQRMYEPGDLIHFYNDNCDCYHNYGCFVVLKSFRDMERQRVFFRQLSAVQKRNNLPEQFLQYLVREGYIHPVTSHEFYIYDGSI